MVSPLNGIARWLGGQLSQYLSQASHSNSTAAPTDPIRLMACLQPCDVLLVEGQTRVSVAIKYLTQSAWSHTALFVAGPPAWWMPWGGPRLSSKPPSTRV